MVRIKDFLRKFNILTPQSADKGGQLVILRGDVNLAPKNRHKYRTSAKAAFSLAEVLVAMLIMSLFFLATTKVISVKQKDDIQEYPHGYYECVGNAAPYQVHRLDGGAVTIPDGTTANVCEFKPIKNIPFYNVYIIRTPSGLFKQTEPQITEESALTFQGAAELLNTYKEIYNEDVQNGDTVEQIMTKNFDNGEYAQFRNYIRTMYPSAVLSRSWTGTHPPFNAVFIVW